MITVRPASERGHFDHGWLNTYHTFSFADYHDPKHTHFRALRVINEDTVQPGGGFGTHPHRDMEIITYILQGGLAHKDSMGNGSTIVPGDVQRMSAGTGVLHSEFNHSPDELVHLLQIWIFPDQHGLKPSYEQKSFSAGDKLNRLRLVASPEASDGSVTIHSDARVYGSVLEAGKSVKHELAKGRGAWVQVIRGEIEVNGKKLAAGDGASIENESMLAITGQSGSSEFLLFDLA
ncbi:MAG TPA: pirin family protein [Terriglobales bacterium]|nr:pirin family protein [Terriglobales bacterium]